MIQDIKTVPDNKDIFAIFKAHHGDGFEIVKCRFVPKFSITSSDWNYEGDNEYNEEQDEYFVPEGWYETIFTLNSEWNHYRMDEIPLAWVDIDKIINVDIPNFLNALWQ